MTSDNEEEDDDHDYKKEGMEDDGQSVRLIPNYNHLIWFEQLVEQTAATPMESIQSLDRVHHHS